MDEFEIIKKHWEYGDLHSGEIAWLINEFKKLRSQNAQYEIALKEIILIGRKTYKTESEIIAEMVLKEVQGT